LICTFAILLKYTEYYKWYGISHCFIKWTPDYHGFSLALAVRRVLGDDDGGHGSGQVRRSQIRDGFSFCIFKSVSDTNHKFVMARILYF
jgi:hypothetical protein